MGDFNRRQISATLTGPLAGEALTGRISAFSHQRDGFLNNLVGVDSNDQNAQGVRAKLAWRPADDFRATLGIEFGRARQNCCVPLFDPAPQAMRDRFATASAGFPFRGSGVPFPTDQINAQTIAVDGRNTYDQDLAAATLELRWILADHELTSITAFRSIDQFSIADIDFTALDLLLFPGVTRKNEQQSQEIRIASPTTGAFSWLAGAYYFRKIVFEDSGLVINPQLAALLGGNVLAQNSPSRSKIDNTNLAVFAEGTFDLTPRLSVTGGLRWNYDDKSIFGFAARLRANGSPLSPTQIIPPAFQNRDGDQVSGRAVIQYDVTDDWNAYASYTRGYKAFGINDDGNLLRNVPGASFFFDSEIVDNYEVGVKGRFPGDFGSLSLVVFRTSYKDFQSLSSFTDATNQLRFFLQNAASLTSQGVELDVTVRPTEHLTLTLAATSLDASFDNFPNAEGPSGPISLTGKPLRDAPEFSSSFVARYDRPITARFSLFAQGDLAYRSKVFTDQNLDPLLVQKAHSKINARIGVRDERAGWSIEAWGRNLTDEITFGRGGQPVFGAVTAVLPFAGSAPFPTAGARVKFTSEPRTYGVTLRASF